MKRARDDKEINGRRHSNVRYTIYMRFYNSSSKFCRSKKQKLTKKKEQKKKNVPHSVRFGGLAISDFEPATSTHDIENTANKILTSANPCPYLSGRCKPGVILQLI